MPGSLSAEPVARQAVRILAIDALVPFPAVSAVPAIGALFSLAVIPATVSVHRTAVDDSSKEYSSQILDSLGF